MIQITVPGPKGSVRFAPGKPAHILFAKSSCMGPLYTCVYFFSKGNLSYESLACEIVLVPQDRPGRVAVPVDPLSVRIIRNRAPGLAAGTAPPHGRYLRGEPLFSAAAAPRARLLIFGFLHPSKLLGPLASGVRCLPPYAKEEGPSAMVDIRLRNSRTRRVEPFEPIDADDVRMYVCGPTVYERAHLGNARPVVVFDMLYRLLRHVYGEDHVTYVRNFTDVDDKINARAAQSGRPIGDITEETIGWYLSDMGALGVLEPDHMPRATAYIPQMVAMIEDLIAKGHAYAAEGHVLFSVASYPAYGALSGRSVDDMIAGARVEVAPYKRDPMDFVLWKPSGPDLPGWESPWGWGRPGWHIECSAMSQELLGPSFDIHGGGNDLMFPHHENEIAQSCCAHPEGEFAKVWMHNEMLQVEGKKMSKSLGNFFTVRDLLDQGVPGEVIRFVFLSTHYSKPMDWTEKKAQEAAKTLWKWHDLVNGVEPGKPSQAVVDALANDLNTHAALSELHRQAGVLMAHEGGADLPEFFVADKEYAEFAGSAQLLGLLTPGVSDWASNAYDLSGHEMLLEAYRAAAMQDKDFSRVDSLKAVLVDAGVEVRMSKTGVELVPGPEFDPAKLEGRPKLGGGWWQ